MSVPRWLVKQNAPLRYLYAGNTVTWLQQGHTYESSSTIRRRSTDVMIFYRANLPVNRRLTLSWLAGGGMVYRPEQSSSVTKEVLPDGRVIDANTTNRTSSRNYMAGAARLDLELKVAPHPSVVPRVRVTVFPSLLDDSSNAPRQLMARPEIAVRWTF